MAVYALETVFIWPFWKFNPSFPWCHHPKGYKRIFIDSNYSNLVSLLFSAFHRIICLVALSYPMDCSPPGSSIHGTTQARILVWVAISFSRGSSWPCDETHIPSIGRWIFYHWVTQKPLHNNSVLQYSFIMVFFSVSRDILPMFTDNHHAYFSWETAWRNASSLSKAVSPSAF